MIRKKTWSKLPVIVLLCLAATFLSGCVGEAIIGQHLREQEQAEQKAKTILLTENTTPTSAGENIALFEERPEGEATEIFRIGNDLGVSNGGKSPTVELKENYYLTEITTYHWNESKGTTPGTITMKGTNGTAYGPWTATLQNGVYWVATPNTTLPAGSYTVIDSDPSTWAQNEESGGFGMTWATGIIVK